MNDYRKAVYQKLADSQELIQLLGKNKPLWDKTKSARQSNSIIPVTKIHPELITPFITIDFGEEDRIDPTERVEFFYKMIYIRAYVAKGFGYGTADEILRIIYQALHEADLDLTYDLSIRLEYESSTGDEHDDGIDQDYIECVYRAYFLR